MALMHRLSRLFAADFHALLDQLEQPETLLKQALRDMQEAIAENEMRAGELVRSIAAQDLETARLDRRLKQVDEHLDSAFAASNHHLAKQMVRQRLELEQHASQLADLAERSRDQQQLLLQRLSEQHATLEGFRQKLTSVQAIAGNNTAPRTVDERITEQDVEARFLTEQRRRVAS